MISDTTLEQILNLWKEDRIKLEEARRLLGLVEETIKWRQPADLLDTVQDGFSTFGGGWISHPSFPINGNDVDYEISFTTNSPTFNVDTDGNIVSITE